MSTVPLLGWPYGGRQSPKHILARLGVDPSSPEKRASTFPFSPEDATCGVENEMQTVVIGSRDCVDLPRIIEESNYFQNIIKRHQRGELPRKVISDLERWLSENPANVWESSWVRFRQRCLSEPASKVLDEDLRCDKRDPESGLRADVGRFLFFSHGEAHLRVPVSYLLKLALADVVGIQNDAPPLIRSIATRLLNHFQSDNTSPETYSFHVIPSSVGEGMGAAVAAESALRFLLIQLLVQYAGRRFGLLATGQKVLVYFSPHPPIRQKALNDIITDSFYRELFMNPCLSGWDRGEDKHRYMHLCHQVLSRAQLNALGRLKEAGIINTNLVVLPTSSNSSLLNNGAHISLGSRMLTRALSDDSSGFLPAHEKYFGDLVIKFVEHFLPLFVGTYSAAPYRLDFGDFHPERVLSFLPYQLDYTHLRMIWRRWKRKAHIKVRPFGVGLTPFGPPWVDGLLSRFLSLKGDFVPDFRLLDYLVGVMSTDRSPALDGRLGNEERLKRDLVDLGVFDSRMPVYLPYRLREFLKKGFSGFEGRIYSQFEGFKRDLAPAVDLQNLLTCLAFQLIGAGRLNHHQIPDSPEVESERRQVFFAAAIGLPTFYVRLDTENLILRSLLKRVPGVRPSRRYPGFLRVQLEEYRRTLVQWLAGEAAGLIESSGLGATVEDLRLRLEHPREYSACGRLTHGSMGTSKARSPIDINAAEFNRETERYYRQGLRLQHMEEALNFLEQALAAAASDEGFKESGLGEALNRVLGGRSSLNFLRSVGKDVLSETVSEEELIRLIDLLLIIIQQAFLKASKSAIPPEERGDRPYEDAHAPIHRQAHR